MYIKKLKHMTPEQKRWAYDRWCEGYTYHQIAEALGLTYTQVFDQLRNLPRVRPILHYTPKEKVNDGKEQILQMAIQAVNASIRGEQGHRAFSEQEQERYGKTVLDICTALFNAGYRRK